MTTFTHRLAIVTGGASGIGRALGRQLVDRGATVVLAHNDEALVHTTAVKAYCEERA